MNMKYLEEDVNYQNNVAGITISGTLTLPDFSKKHGAVILIAGYGPHDRNLTFMGKQQFRVIAEYLTSKGIAVLRFDKRGVGKSTGNYNTATSKDFASDVIAGIEYLKTRSDIDTHKIGLIGLSEGGLIASIIASESKDVSFVILMAPAVLTKRDGFIDMAGLQMKADGASEGFIKRDSKLREQIFVIIKYEPDFQIAEKKLLEIVENYLDQLSESQKIESEKVPFAFSKAKAEAMVKTFNSVWYRYFLSIRSDEILKKIKIPVLVLNGDRDWITSPDKTFPIIDQALKAAENSDYSLVKLSNVNHAFQTCKTGAMMEYGTIQESISTLVLNTISDWILSRTNRS